jgi:hypothetical protein
VEALLKVDLTARAAPSSVLAPCVAFDAPDLAHVTYGPLQWYVHLCTTTPQFGGHRRWFVCPACSSRRTALYVGGTTLACRVCLGLRYASQHETERDRMFRRVGKLRDRLDWRGGIAEGGSPPQGGRQRKYEHLCRKLASLTAKIFSDLDQWVDRAEATVGLPRPPAA